MYESVCRCSPQARRWTCCPAFGSSSTNACTARADALFELTDAVLCADGPVKTLVELSLAVEHRRGHGAMYAALDRGWLEPARLRRDAGRPAAAEGGRRADRAGRGREQLAPSRRSDQRRPAVLPRLRTWCPEHGPVRAGLAVLLRRRAGDGPHLLGRHAGRRAPWAGRRRDRRHRRPTPRRRRAVGASRAVAGRGSRRS